MAEILSSSTQSPTSSSSSLSSMIPLSSGSGISAAANNITQFVEHPGIFLQSSSAKIIAGAFAWTALFITCHQVIFFSFLNLNFCFLIILFFVKRFINI